ncbi:hypothetical protein [uncultured Polaribacter sp.]|uniref:hypothetical protein n=1 Tax=uncultured Polaribacter sp. TaxID=174711 RepID=UPI00262F16C4|nr:hypothetical protein [uncultured Polaribacter sp.]
MKEYSEFFNFGFKNDSATRNKIFTYFKSYNFRATTEEKQQIIFENKCTWLDTWKTNIFKLQSKITIHFLADHKVQIHYQVINAGFGSITPLAFTNQYQDFIKNLDNYIHKNESFQLKNETLIKSGKVKLLKNLGILLVALVFGFVLASLLKKQIANGWVATLLIIATVFISEKVINAYHTSKSNA